MVSEVVDQQALAELFGGLDFDAGWASYRDKTVIDNRCTDLNNLLEGEWASSAFTLQVATGGCQPLSGYPVYESGRCRR